MQVTHVSDHSTHAVIGANKTIELGVSNSAHLMHILSTALYTNQKLAVVREVICNAWDAHIACNITDKPVEVTLTEEYLTIRDFASGIAPDKIGPLYGTYGGTNKTLDGTQTGGFGLGCKSPLAYVDHFEVTSCYEGTKTIYSMAKVAPGAEGKGGLTPLVTVPTTDSGITVKIRLKRASDMHEFDKLIKEVVFRGEIHATLHGEVLPVLPMSKARDGWAVVDSLDGKNASIFVRYGNVLYPVPEHDDYSKQYSVVKSRLDNLSRQSNLPRSLIITAPAHSISVTPSREAVSLQPHTVQTFKTLLNNIHQVTEECFSKVLPQYAREMVKKVLDTPDPFKKLFSGYRIVTEHCDPQDKFIDRPSYLKKNFSLASFHHMSDLSDTMVIDELRTKKEIPGHLARSLIRLARTNEWKYNRRILAGWFYRYLLEPLSRNMAVAGLDPKNWRVHMPHSDTLVNWQDLFWSPHGNTGLREILHLATTRVIISHMPRTSPLCAMKRQDICGYDDVLYDRAKELNGLPTLVYVVKRRRKEDIQAATDYFSKRAKEVIVMARELEPYVRTPRVKGAAAPVKKRQGYPHLGYGLDGDYVDFSTSKRTDDKRTEDPKCWILSKNISGMGNGYLHGYPGSSAAVLKLFGQDCAVVTEPQSLKLIEQGVPKWGDYVAAAIVAEISSNPKYLELYGHDYSRYEYHSYERRDTAKVLLSITAFRTMYGIPNIPVLDAREQMFWEIWEEQLQYPRHDLYKPLAEQFKKAPLIKAVQDVIDAVERATVLNVFSSYRLSDLFDRKYDKQGKTPSKHLLEAIINILKEA